MEDSVYMEQGNMVLFCGKWARCAFPLKEQYLSNRTGNKEFTKTVADPASNFGGGPTCFLGLLSCFHSL